MHVGKKEKQACCGCTACEVVCPVQAIKMQPDKLGFYYPHVDENLCVDCERCINYCQFHTQYDRFQNYDEPSIYGCRLKDEAELLRSQSGGISHAIVENLIKQDYVIYGAAFVSPDRVAHIRVNDSVSAQALRGSKYVQSDLNGVFKAVANDLEHGSKVLFIGTSCQVAGLKSTISSEYSKLLVTVDLICHGVPSPKIWKDHILFYEKKFKHRVVTANFRDKKYGWHSRRQILTFDNGKKFSVRTFNIITDLAVRSSCAHCPFTNFNRVGDITIGDFWGWEKHYSLWNDNKGVSLVMVNSDKGSFIFNQLKNVETVKATKQLCYQPQLSYPIKLNSDYSQFQLDYIKNGYTYTMKKYSDLSLLYKIKQECYKFKAFLLKLKG